MSQPSSQDFLQAFDPTGYTTITGAQLLQYITGAAPFTDKGLIVVSTDAGGNPNVPNAATTTKWQNYLWLRIGASSISIYAWNPSLASDVTYLQWQGINTAGIPAASIQGYQIASNTIVDANIANINWSKILNAPTALPPNGTAGPTVLSGTYPDPSINNGGISSAMIAQNAVTGGATGQLGLAANGVDVTQNIKVPASSTLGSPSGSSGGAPVANDRLVVGVGATAYATVRKALDALAEPTTPYSIIQVNAAGTGFQYALGARVLQQKLMLFSDKVSTTGNVSTTGQPVYNATGNKLVNSTTLQFTPLSASSTLFLELTLNGYCTNLAYLYAGLYTAQSTAVNVAYGVAYNNPTSADAMIIPIIAKATLASPGTSAITFYATLGASAGTAYANSVDGSTVVFGGINSYLKITEYL